MTPLHPQTRIEYSGRAADVDVEIAPLILELWRAGLWTSLSCQEGVDGRVWIGFAHASALEEFLRVLFPERDDAIESLYNRAVGGIEPDEWEAFREERAWRYRLHAEDALEDDATTTRSDIYLAADVHFPRRDLDEVLARLHRHNARIEPR
jgi:hypothetical protein